MRELKGRVDLERCLWVRRTVRRTCVVTLGAALVFTAACSSRTAQVHQPSVSAASVEPPAEGSASASPGDQGTERERRVQILLNDAVRLVETGRRLYYQGRRGEGEYLFGQAFELLSTGAGHLADDPRIVVRREALEREVLRIHIASAYEYSETTFPLGEKVEGPPSPREIIAALDLYTIEVDPALEGVVSEDLRETPFDFPVMVNRRVLQLLDYYQHRAKDQTQSAMERAGKYLPHFRRIFAEEGVPVDLVYLGHAESLFKPNAYSRARARGMWQFMAGTAALYDLEVGWWLDERLDPFKSARAAARHLRDLKAEFGDWYLALAAYNAGPGRIRRVFRRYGNLDYWTMVERRLLPRETQNYVPAVLAAMILYRHPERYGFEPPQETALEFEEVPIAFQVDLKVAAEALGVEADVLEELNPELVRGITPFSGQSYQLRVPLGFAGQAARVLSELPPEKRLRWAHHRVGKGETLSHIARRYNVSIGAIAEVNRLRNLHRLSIGQDLIIPLSDWRAATDSPAERDEVYTVRSGDSLYRIARRYGLKVQDLQVWNGLDDSPMIYPGQQLRLFGGEVTER